MKINVILTPDNGKTLTEACEPLVDSLGSQSFGKGLLARGALKLAGAMSDRTFTSLIDKLKPKMNSFINTLLVKKSISADVQVVSIVKEGDTMCALLDVTNVDYPALADSFLPVLIESKRNQAPDNLLPAVSDAMGEEQTAAVHAFLNALSEDTKERIAAQMLSRRKMRVCEKLSLALKKKNLDLSVTDVEMI